MKPRLFCSQSTINILTKNNNPPLNRLIKRKKPLSPILLKNQTANSNNSVMNTQEVPLLNKSNEENSSKRCFEPLDTYGDRIRDVFAQYHGIDHQKLYGSNDNNSSPMINTTESFQLASED